MVKNPYNFEMNSKEYEPTITPETRNLIDQYIKKRYQWKAHQYEIQPMEHWDMKHIPLFVALPKIRTNASPVFIILPNNHLLTRGESQAFERIISEYFSAMTPKDAEILAQLAVYFGMWTEPIGSYWDRPGEHHFPPKTQPRNPPTQLKLKADQAILEFYAFDGELLQLSDCKVTIQRGKIEYKVTKIKK